MQTKIYFDYFACGIREENKNVFSPTELHIIKGTSDDMSICLRDVPHTHKYSHYNRKAIEKIYYENATSPYKTYV